MTATGDTTMRGGERLAPVFEQVSALQQFEERQDAAAKRPVNVGADERAVSVAAGGVLALLGLGRRDLIGTLIAALGGDLIYRGVSGYCWGYQALGLNTAEDTARPEQMEERGTHAVASFLIDKPAEELYGYWRNFENLPSIMSYLQQVQVIDEKRSHWVTKAPKVAGGSIEWDAEITADEPNRRIAWRSLPGSSVEATGEVKFEKALGDRGTQVTVHIDYIVPGGTVGKWAAKLMGQSPEKQIYEDLRRFKRVMETGEAISTEGQPRGTCFGKGKRESS